MTYWLLSAIVFLQAGIGDAAEGASAPRHAQPGSYQREAREAVEEVLARREFAHLHADPHGGFRAFLEWLRDAWRRTGAALDSLPRWAFWLIVAWMVLTLVAIVAHLVYTLVMLLRGSSRAALRRGTAERHQGELFGVRDLEFESVYERARDLLAEGNWGEAVRYLYVAAILWLDRTGRIAFRLSKTNWDYLRELRSDPQRHAQFRRLTERFEATVYGAERPSGDQCQTVASVVEGLVHEVAPGGAR